MSGNINFESILMAGPVAAPDGYNGAASTLDVISPADFIHHNNKIITSENNVMSLRHTIIFNIWNSMGKPTVATAVTAAHIASTSRLIGINVVKHTLLALFHAADILIVLRSSDVMSVNALTALMGSSIDLISTAADRLWAYFMDNDALLNELCSDKKHVALAIVATAMHRYMVDQHNWLTNLTRKAGSVTNKITMVAGADRTEFIDFMETVGHDVWHMLSNETLIRVCDAVTGVTEAIVVSPGVNDGGEPLGYFYNSVNVVGDDICDIIKLNDGATDRWPVNGLGKASIIVGTNLIRMVVIEISSKALIDNLSTVNSSFEAIKTYIADSDLSRAEVLNLKEALGPMIAKAYGFLNQNSATEDFANTSPALVNFVKTLSVDVAFGAVFAKRFREVVTDPMAVKEMIKVFLSGIASITTNDTVVPAGAQVFVVPADFSITTNPTV